MLNITLLTVEDENAAELYEQIHVQLREWIFVKKEIVHLRHPERETRRWVTNLEDWRRVIEPLLQENDLVFCTVDLRIPEQADGGCAEPGAWLEDRPGDPGVRREGLHCCVLTGLANAELQGLIADGEAIPEVLFDFKGDVEPDHRNVVNCVKSQALAMLQSLRFRDARGELRTVLLRERSGRLRETFLSKAPYYVEASTWHVPILLIGAPGLGGAPWSSSSAISRGPS